jgi:ABC-2 type transport system permease protein
MSALRSYVLLVKWQALRMKMYLPIMIVVQALFALGIVIGYPLLFPQLDSTTILFLATGAPAITLITVGLVMVPQLVTQSKTEGTLEYMRALPIPRLTYLAADLTIWLVIVMPGVILAIAIAALRFNLDLTVSPLVVPGLMLVALTGSCVGYALASLLPQQAANLISQVLVVFVLMFSPLNFPVERLPDWLAAIHRVLPVQAMGEIIRGTVASNSFPLSAGPFLLLGAWCLAGFGVTYWALSRRA